MTTTAYPTRTGEIRYADVLVKLPRLVIAAVLWLLVIEALPERAAWGVLVVVIGGTVTALLSESVIVRLVWWARRASTHLAVPGDPRVRVLVTRRPAEGIGQAGRRYLIVPAAWIGRADVPSLLARARLRQVVSAGRFEVAYQWFTWPWQVLGSAVIGFARGASWLPLIGFAWRVRLVVSGIAVWQTVVAGQHAATIGILLVIGLSYLLPWTRARHERLVRNALAGVPLPTATPSRPTTGRPAALPFLAPGAVGGRTPCSRVRRVGVEACGRRCTASGLVTCRGQRTHGRAHRRPITGRNGYRS